MATNIVTNVSSRDLDVPVKYGGGTFAANTKVAIEDEQSAICEAFETNTTDLSFMFVPDDMKYRMLPGLKVLSVVQEPAP